VCLRGFVRTRSHDFKIDSAAAYYNEEPCGAAMRNSGIPRSEIFFTSKIPPKKMGYQKTKTQVDESLKASGLEYIDLMLIHAPYGGSQARKGVWKALLEAQDEGKIRSLGISNYGVHHLDEMEVHIKELEEERGKGRGGVVDVGRKQNQNSFLPLLLPSKMIILLTVILKNTEWELHPWLARPDITEWCQKRGIVVQAYCPIVRGNRMEEPAVQQLAKKYQKTAAQVLLRWSLQKGFVPLPKSVTPSRIDENADLYDFELTSEDMDSLATGEYAPCAWDPTTSELDN
jgi:diketogulonate reductase-like aldo/keto reductase